MSSGSSDSDPVSLKRTRRSTRTASTVASSQLRKQCEEDLGLDSENETPLGRLDESKLFVLQQAKACTENQEMTLVVGPAETCLTEDDGDPLLNKTRAVIRKKRSETVKSKRVTASETTVSTMLSTTCSLKPLPRVDQSGSLVLSLGSTRSFSLCVSTSSDNNKDSASGSLHSYCI